MGILKPIKSNGKKVVETRISYLESLEDSGSERFIKRGSMKNNNSKQIFSEFEILQGNQCEFLVELVKAKNSKQDMFYVVSIKTEESLIFEVSDKKAASETLQIFQNGTFVSFERKSSLFNQNVNKGETALQVVLLTKSELIQFPVVLYKLTEEDRKRKATKNLVKWLFNKVKWIVFIVLTFEE